MVKIGVFSEKDINRANKAILKYLERKNFSTEKIEKLSISFLECFEREFNFYHNAHTGTEAVHGGNAERQLTAFNQKALKSIQNNPRDIGSFIGIVCGILSSTNFVEFVVIREAFFYDAVKRIIEEFPEFKEVIKSIIEHTLLLKENQKFLENIKDPNGHYRKQYSGILQYLLREVCG